MKNLISALPENLAVISAAVLECWPEHLPFLTQRFSVREESCDLVAEESARVVLLLHRDDLTRLAEDYRWMCEQLLQEEIFFRRHGTYRNSSFDAVECQVYGDKLFMSRYLNGLLISQVLWINQATALSRFVNDFLPACEGGTLIEFGPGHGLLLYFAANSGRFLALRGWDISETSLAMTRRNLEILGVDLCCEVEIHDVRRAPTHPLASALVMSELLEHVEDPLEVLRGARSCLMENGLIFINVPINSPAPDHIFLWESPEAVSQCVTDAGFSIDKIWLAPMTGYTIQRALNRRVTVSVIIIARRVG